MCLFHCIEICTNGGKTMVNKITDAFAQINGAAPNSTRDHYSLHDHALLLKEKQTKTANLT